MQATHYGKETDQFFEAYYVVKDDLIVAYQLTHDNVWVNCEEYRAEYVFPRIEELEEF